MAYIGEIADFLFACEYAVSDTAARVVRGRNSTECKVVETDCLARAQTNRFFISVKLGFYVFTAFFGCVYRDIEIL